MNKLMPSALMQINPISAREMGDLSEYFGGIVKKLQVEMNMGPQFWTPYLISENEPVIQATLAAVEEIVGAKPKILGKAGCTDASHIFHMGAIPTVVFGPGNEKPAHQPDECVEIKQYVAAVPIFQSLFRKLLG